jgi:hypothetical protein
MEKIIQTLINSWTKGVDTYTHNGSTWLIFTDNKQWVIELTESKTLWYNYNFFKQIFSLTSLDVVENQQYITKWVEDNIINSIKELFYHNLISKNIIKETLSKGIDKNTYIVKLPNKIYYRQMDIAFIDNKYLPWYLLYFGSSKDFSKKIRIIASKKGYKLNEKGLFDKKSGKKINFEPTNEKEIFDYLKIDYVKPENR